MNKKAIVILILGAFLYFVSFLLVSSYSHDVVWGMGDALRTAQQMCELAGYMKIAGIILAIGGALWLIVSAIQGQRNVSESTQQNDNRTAFCSNCGKKYNKSSARFCENCGIKLD